MSSTLADRIRADMDAAPFHQWLRPELVSADRDAGVVVRLPVRPEFRRQVDEPHVHGGVVAALIDIAGYAAVTASLGVGAPTIDLRIDYLRMAGGRELLAEARVLKRGRSVSVVDVRVLDDGGRLVAAGRGGFASNAGS